MTASGGKWGERELCGVCEKFTRRRCVKEVINGRGGCPTPVRYEAALLEKCTEISANIY
jgi:hypothetical protein